MAPRLGKGSGNKVVDYGSAGRQQCPKGHVPQGIRGTPHPTVAIWGQVFLQRNKAGTLTCWWQHLWRRLSKNLSRRGDGPWAKCRGLQLLPNTEHWQCCDLNRCWGLERHVLVGDGSLGWHRLVPLVILVAFALW